MTTLQRTPRRGLENLLGAGLVFVLALAVVAVYKSFRGDFSRDLTVSAAISQVGDALRQGDIVTYRDVIVGEVTAAAADVDGGAVLKLKIDRAAATAIPAGVQAIAVPASLFGATQINLLPPRDLSGPTLRDGELIKPDTSPGAQSLQTALADAYTLLTAVHPAELDAALSALATALQGQGDNLARLVDRADAYLERLIPSLPHLDTVITSFATVTRQLARNTPSLLHSVANLLVVSKGVIAGQQAVDQLLKVAPTALDNAQLLLDERNVDNAVTVLRNEGPVLRALGARPDALPDTIHGFRAFAEALAPTMTSGPYVKVNIILTGANLATLFGISAGQKGTTFAAVSDPPTYPLSACPRYGSLPGPNCPAQRAPADASRVLLTSGGTVSSIGSPDEVATVRAAAAAITGLPQEQIPAAADLLLGPLLRGTPTVIR